MRFQTITLGCKVNQYETELIRETFSANGWTEEPDSSLADWIVVNTCAVTAESEAKCRKIISSAAKRSPQAKIAVFGCSAAASPDRLARLPNVAVVLGDKRRLPEFFYQLGLTRLPDGVSSLGERHRAYIKVQDGCRVGCAYCIIPQTRPYLASRSSDAVVREVVRLAEAGYREIVLTGIHLGHYGLDLDAAALGRKLDRLEDFLAARNEMPSENRHTLAKLLERILAEKLPVRYRLGSLEAVETPDELIDLIAESAGGVCPHFHLSMQSGSDAVLTGMRRRWLSGPFIRHCEEIRKKIPLASLTTDVIVGFPGETESDFLESCEAVRYLEFAKTHIFRFSSRPGTLAAGYPNPVPEPVKKDRAARLETAAQSARCSYARRLIGHTVQTLVEEFRDGNGKKGEADGKGNGRLFASGMSEYYLPVRVEAETETLQAGDWFSSVVKEVSPSGELTA